MESPHNACDLRIFGDRSNVRKEGFVHRCDNQIAVKQDIVVNLECLEKCLLRQARPLMEPTLIHFLAGQQKCVSPCCAVCWSA